MSGRVPIPQAVQNRVLFANRHACCICQAKRVQLHHIDGNPANNDPANIAPLCLDHHDQASMQIGLSKKIQPAQVRAYKTQWEERCSKDILALSRKRFTFYYCIYKNPPRIKEAYLALSEAERKRGVEAVRERLLKEQGPKDSDSLFGLNAVPEVNEPTLMALRSVYAGEARPSYLGTFKAHPADPDYSTDSSTQEAMTAFHLYDLWCQVVVQVIAEARGAVPLEDLYAFETESEFDNLVGALVTFKLSIRGKNIHIPRYWQEHPVGQISAAVKNGGKTFRIRMQLRTMYLFSDTAAINLERGRVSGIGLFNGAVQISEDEYELTVVPLLIGAGGWNLYPENFPQSYSADFERQITQ